MAYRPQLNDRVRFIRGMYGEWTGRVADVYAARADRWCSSGGVRTTKKGDLYVIVRYAKKKGGYGSVRLPASAVLPIPYAPAGKEAV